MLGRLADALARRRIDVRYWAHLVAANLDDDRRRLEPLLHREGEVLQALIDLGWSHEIVKGLDVREVGDDIRRIYLDKMTDRVLQMMRRWEKRGWLSDKGA